MIDEANFNTLKQEFIGHLTQQRRAHATILAYGKDIDQLTKFLVNSGKNDIKEILKDDIEAFTGKLKNDGYTPKSISRKINSIKTFYRFLKNNNMVSVNPAIEIRHPKYDIKPPRVLSKTEYRALRDACRSDARTYAIVELFLQTGIRIGELSRLQLDDIKDKDVTITADNNNQSRVVPLNKAAKLAWDNYLKLRPTSSVNAAFITKTGKPLLIRNIRTSIDRFFRIAGITDAKINDLRHTFIAHHLASGSSLTTISRIVGHKRISTTEKYLDLIKEHEKASVKLEEL